MAIHDCFPCREFGIEAAAYELPGAPIDIADWAVRHNYPRARVEAIVRNGSRCFHAAPGIGEVELAIRAVGRLLAQSRVAACDIAFVILAHSQQFSVPAAPRSLPLEVAAAHGLRPRWAGSVAQLNCVSIAAGLRTAQALMRAHAQAGAALVLSVDRVYGEAYRLRQESGIQSDGAACLLVTRGTPGNRLGAIAIQNRAAWHVGSDADKAVEDQMGTLEWPLTRSAMEAASAASGIALARFGLILPRNGDLPQWTALCRAMGMPDGRLYTENMARRGHACCSDFTINLADAGLAAVAAGQHVMGVMQSNTGAFGAVTLHPTSTRHDPGY